MTDTLTKISLLQAAIRQLVYKGEIKKSLEDRIAEDILDSDYTLDRSDKPTPENYGGQQ